ncbi:MAG: hypothetical protein Q9220_006642 [cf. Caloplaca sp. 1 TL-2023]
MPSGSLAPRTFFVSVSLVPRAVARRQFHHHPRIRIPSNPRNRPRTPLHNASKSHWRFTSTATTFTTTQVSQVSRQDARSLVTRLKNLFLGTTITLATVLGYYYITDTRASIHEWLVIPSLRYFYEDAEDAHEFGNRALKGLYSFGLHPRERSNPDSTGDLAVEVFGHTLLNPIGTSAGIDKHCDLPDVLLGAGPALIEIGGVPPLPQEGNPSPRVWRIPSQKALINRYGFNSEGADHVAMKLRQRVRQYAQHLGFGVDEEAERKVLDGEAGVPPGSLQQGKLMAVQIGKNSWTSIEDIEAVKKDYVYCVDALARWADILVVNVSSPNTPGLRGLQKAEPLTDILTAVVDAARKIKRKIPVRVMVKVSPDEDGEEDVRGICDAVWDSQVDGIVVGNTTRKRPDPVPEGFLLPAREQKILLEQGGYSGPQLFDRTIALVKRYRAMLDKGSYHEYSDAPSPSEPESTPKDPKPSASTTSIGKLLETQPETHPPTTPEEIDQSVTRDRQHLKPETPEAELESKSQPLLRIPERNNPFSSSSTSPTTSAPHQQQRIQDLAASSSTDTLPSPSLSPQSSSGTSSSSSASPPKDPSPHHNRKVIFATGGITNGAQVLEVLDAGADVAQVYTAMVYGGIGTISKIKLGMREEIERRKGR